MNEPKAQGLIERWQQRQQALKGRLAALGVADGARELQWARGRVVWRAPSGEGEATAEMRALCSYFPDDGSVQMAWVNAEAGQAVIEALPSIPELIEDCSEGEAWLWAMRVAEAAGAEYLMPLSSPELLVFVGLWKLHDALDSALAEAGSPLALVLSVLDGLLDGLRGEVRDGSLLRQQFLNQADSLRQASRYLSEAGADAARLQRTCDTLHALGATFAAKRFGLLPARLPTAPDLAEVEQTLVTLRREWLRDRS